MKVWGQKMLWSRGDKLLKLGAAKGSCLYHRFGAFLFVPAIWCKHVFGAKLCLLKSIFALIWCNFPQNCTTRWCKFWCKFVENFNFFAPRQAHVVCVFRKMRGLFSWNWGGFGWLSWISLKLTKNRRGAKNGSGAVFWIGRCAGKAADVGVGGRHGILKTLETNSDVADIEDCSRGPMSVLVRGLLGTDPADLTLESALPSLPQGSIWHRFNIDSTSISWCDPISMPNRPLKRGGRGGFEGGVRARGACA